MAGLSDAAYWLASGTFCFILSLVTTLMLYGFAYLFSVATYVTHRVRTAAWASHPRRSQAFPLSPFPSPLYPLPSLPPPSTSPFYLPSLPSLHLNVPCLSFLLPRVKLLLSHVGSFKNTAFSLFFGLALLWAVASTGYAFVLGAVIRSSKPATVLVRVTGAPVPGVHARRRGRDRGLLVAWSAAVRAHLYDHITS
jgi:hypothetical protein